MTIVHYYDAGGLAIGAYYVWKTGGAGSAVYFVYSAGPEIIWTTSTVKCWVRYVDRSSSNLYSRYLQGRAKAWIVRSLVRYIFRYSGVINPEQNVAAANSRCSSYCRRSFLANSRIRGGTLAGNHIWRDILALAWYRTQAIRVSATVVNIHKGSSGTFC